MGTEGRRRAVLVGTDMLQLFTLAGELEAQGLDVAMYSDADRALDECHAGACALLVAMGRLGRADAGAVPCPVPFVLLDASDGPLLPMRPSGPHAVLKASASPESVTARALALLEKTAVTAEPPTAADEPPAAPPAPADVASAAAEAGPARPARPTREVQSPPEPADAATAAVEARPARPAQAARGIQPTRWAFRLLLIVAGLAVGLALGLAFLAWAGAR